ncbi:MAG TPA: hypothetical protein VLF67_01010, partial [Candidatus Saccharimonas sp.]|nr:hypothetical protein [Candidatus Saccharimonas sp.]
MKLGGWSPKTFHHLCLVAACLIGAMRVTDYLDVPTTPAVLSAAAVQQPAPSITPVPLATAAPSPTPSASPTPIPATTSKPAGSTYSYGI